MPCDMQTRLQPPVRRFLAAGRGFKAATIRGTPAAPGWAKRLLIEDRGQDLVEYALLAGFVGVVAAATWVAIESSLATAYVRYDTKTQGLWEPPEPGAAGP
jgi:Flp pilus assembly pilin Flp